MVLSITSLKGKKSVHLWILSHIEMKQRCNFSGLVLLFCAQLVLLPALVLLYFSFPPSQTDCGTPVTKLIRVSVDDQLLQAAVAGMLTVSLSVILLLLFPVPVGLFPVKLASFVPSENSVPLYLMIFSRLGLVIL